MTSQNGNFTSHEERKYIGMTLDPVHIGTGGYRLGRVDNTIARDPTTNVPVVFGSSLEGTARTYSAYQLIEIDTSTKAIQEEEEESLNNKPVKRKDYLDCAGKSDEEIKKRVQCGACEICLTYGFSTKEKSLHGMAQFSDAQILFFPVHTMYGPAWVTCPGILNDFLVDGIGDLDSKLSILKNKEEKAWTNLKTKGKINLGWLYLGVLENNGITPNTWTFNDGKTETKKKLGEIKNLKEILDRIVIVSDSLFSQVVNSNLEVRTSVSIDPKTGAAEEGALFTYEAIPRATIMYFTVTYLNPENFNLNEVKFKYFDHKDNKIKDQYPEMNDVIDTVKKGIELFEFLGIGGMNTRGFGRFKIFNLGDSHEK